jgi:hypothetical protein
MLSKEASRLQYLNSSAQTKPYIAFHVPALARVTKRCAHNQQQQQQGTADLDSSCHLGDAQQQQLLRTAVIATAVCCAFVRNVGAARADGWVPRRHHRHIGERFTDTWADSIVEVRLELSFIPFIVSERMLQ